MAHTAPTHLEMLTSPLANLSTVPDMGQDHSSTKQPVMEPETESLHCFHNMGSSDANLALLREKNVWIGEELTTQSDEEKALPPNLEYDQFPDHEAYEERQFYCEACCRSRFPDGKHGGFLTRCVQRLVDGHMVRIITLLMRSCVD